MPIQLDFRVFDISQKIAVRELSVGSRVNHCCAGGVMARDCPEDGQVRESRCHSKLVVSWVGCAVQAGD